MPKPYYEHNGITIYHGDCREILPLLPKADLILTDPPYAIGATRGEWSVTASVAVGLHEAARRVLKTGALVAFTASSGRGIEFTQGAIGKLLPFNRLLIWHKENGRSRALSPWRWDSVAVLVFGRAPRIKTEMSSVYATDVNYERETDHPGELPSGLADWLYCPFEAAITIDPFMGTGRLLEPAVEAGRKAIGIEIEEKYCEIAANRLTQEVLQFT